MNKLNLKFLVIYIILVITFFTLSISSFGQGTNQTAKALIEQGNAALKKKDYDVAITLYKQAVEQEPTLEDAYSSIFAAYRSKKRNKFESLPDDQDKIKFWNDENAKTAEDLEKIFQEWNSKYPNNKILIYFYALVYQNTNREKQEQFLLKILKLDPDYYPALKDLSLIEEVRGNNVKSSEYLKKAVEKNPQNASAALAYAFSFLRINPELYRQKSLEIAEKFPKDERGAQSLYWVAEYTTDKKEKISILEKLKSQYPPDQFNWSLNSLPKLFQAYQATDPDKALEFAKAMMNSATEPSAKKKWQDRIDYQQSIIQAQNLINEKKYIEASNILDKIKPQGAFNMTDVYLLKAKALSLSGEPSIAYNNLLKQYIEEPTDSLAVALVNTGKTLGKSPTQITSDISAQLEAKAKPLKHFSFVRYDNGKTVSISDFRGKVILLNFWYPSCGPCRAEGPGLQKILEKNKDKFIILAPNVIPGEDSFVMPYLKNNKYSFIPLKSSEEFVKSEFNSTSFPTNLLVDPQGRVIYQVNRAFSGESEHALELQIEMLSKLGKD